MRCLLLIAFVLAACCSAAHALNRPADPVIFTGAEVPSLAGIAPQDLVAFRWESGWHQVPVQVDERAVVDFKVAMNQGPGGLTRLDYTDSNTFTGPDPDPTLDADDEIVFMAGDVGLKPAEFSEPAGVVAGSGIQVTISDPLGSAPGYVYLFRQDGSLDPAAGRDYVSYQFNLLSGDYKTTYKTRAGPNPEDTTVTTDYYQVHFQDRWIQDGVRIYAGSATAVDILDMHNSQFAPGNCARTIITFSEGEGAFIVNKDGPVRAIRSYIGANSGPWTQRQHVYYAAREDVTTFLRVHAIPSVVDFMDYSPAAAGMQYYSNNHTSGATIDGAPDTVTAGTISWELVAGAQGSLVITSRLDTDIPDPSSTSYYLDDVTPNVTQCAGDEYAYGSSGVWVDHGIPNTDPFMTPPVYRFVMMKTHYYGPPGATVAHAEQRNECVDHPLVAGFASWVQTALAGQVRVSGTTTNIEGASVEAYLDGELQATAVTGADGIYQITQLSDGLYVVKARKHGYAVQSKPDIAVASGQVTYVNFNLEVSGRLMGQVRDKGTTTNVDGATLVARCGGQECASGTTTANGIYAMDSDLPAGTYAVSVAKLGWVTQTKTNIGVTADSTTYVNFFAFERMPAIMGQVRVAGATTNITGAMVEVFGGDTAAAMATTEANGIYRIPAGLEPGTYQVAASAAGYVRQTRSGIQVNQNTTAYANFNLQQSGKLKGQVKDQFGGAPIVGATVVARRDGIVRGTGTTTAPWGIYEMASNLPAGTYVVGASNTGYLGQTRKDIPVTAGATTYVNFFLQPQ
jgi:hypothetical protein